LSSIFICILFRTKLEKPSGMFKKNNGCSGFKKSLIF
jgi:hypothetical protein